MKSSFTRCQKHVQYSESNQEFLENGIYKERLELLEHQVESGCLTSLASTPVQTSMPSEKKKTLCVSCTQESPVQNKKMILNDKKNTSETIVLTNVQKSKKSQTLVPESISKDKDCYKFWDSSNKALYQQLSWLQETALPDLDSSLLNGCVKSSELKSWFSTIKIQPQNQSLETTSWQLSKFTVVDGMEKEDTKTKITKARKLRLKPTSEQKILLNQWAGCTRFLYNKTISTLTNKKNKSIRSKNQLRSRLVSIKNQYTEKQNNFYNNKPWLGECPANVRKGAVYDAKANLQSCFTNFKNENIKQFTSPYKTKKKEQTRGWSFSLEKADVSKKEDKLFIFQGKLKEMKYFGTKQLHKLIPNTRPEMDCKLQKTAFGEYFLIIPYAVQLKKQRSMIHNPVSIDPGVRKFLTTYAPNNKESFMIGNRWTKTVMPLLLKLDREQNKETRIKLRKRIANLKDELRNKSANFLAKRYDLILMPKLDTAKLSIKATRRLKTKTVREMLNAGHSKFFHSLKSKCLENGTKFLHVGEEYTSQTCPSCGELNKCNEVYKCKKCSYKHDRDMVGALNILLKAVQNPSQE